MNLVGKIITVALLLMSILFMGFAVMSYATSQNYKAMVNGADGEPAMNTVLQEANQKLEARELELQQLKMRLALEQAARRSALAALETKSRQLNAQLQEQQQAFAQVLAQHEQNVQLIATEQETIAELKTKVDAARSQLASDYQQRDALLKAIGEITDQLNQGEGQLRRLKERHDQLKRGITL